MKINYFQNIIWKGGSGITSSLSQIEQKPYSSSSSAPSCPISSSSSKPLSSTQWCIYCDWYYTARQDVKKSKILKIQWCIYTAIDTILLSVYCFLWSCMYYVHIMAYIWAYVVTNAMHLSAFHGLFRPSCHIKNQY